MHRVFIRTSQGNDELCNPSGVLSGDEKRLMELINDSLSLSEIKSRVPLSVQRQLDAILARLLSMTYIAQTDSGMPDEKPEKASDDIQTLTVQDDPAMEERTRRIEFSTLQIRLHVAEALLRGQVRKVLRANQLLSSLSAPSEF